MSRSGAQLVMFITVLVAVVGLVHYYLYARLVRAPDLPAVWQRAGGVALLVLAIATPVGMVLARTLGRPIGTAIAAGIFVWFGLAVLMFFGVAASELVRLGAHGVAAIVGAPLDAERRTFLSRALAGGVVAVAAIAGASGMASALGAVAVRRVRVALGRLPPAMSGFRIAQLSDLHIGPTLGKGWLAGVVARTNAEQPDAIVITGDLVDGSVEDLRAEVAPLGDLRAKHGVFFVTGNHEYYSGVDAWIAELTRLGVRVLRNERVSIGDGAASFDLAGVDDYSAAKFGNGHGADMGRAFAGRDPARELVLLAHQPKHIDEAASHGVGLQLSGHTHGGQIFPWSLFVRLDQPYVAGLSRHKNAQIYVSCGTGFWGPPMRVGAPSEIALVELVAA